MHTKPSFTFKQQAPKNAIYNIKYNVTLRPCKFIQDHRNWYQSTRFLLVVNSNLGHISDRFRDIETKNSEIAVLTPFSLIQGHRSDWTPGNCRVKFGSKNRFSDLSDSENPIILLHLSGLNTGVWHTDRRTRRTQLRRAMHSYAVPRVKNRKQVHAPVSRINCWVGNRLILETTCIVHQKSGFICYEPCFSKLFTFTRDFYLI